MTEEVEEQQSQPLDLHRYLNIARRRHLYFLVPAFVGWLVVWGSSWFLQARYKSETTILVQQPSISREYVTPSVNDDLQERLQSIKQQILSRTRLLTIIDKLHLYDGGRRHFTPDEKVAMMIKDIDIEVVQDPRTEQINAFSISFSSANPYIAQQVASDLTDLFINTNTNVAQQESQKTTDFLKTQLDAARLKLQDQEAKVKAFEATHEGALPDQQAANLQISSNASSQLQNADSALATARQQREFIQTEIAEYKTSHVSTRSPDGKPTGLAGLDLQLDQLSAKLADLLSSHTEQYPDVISTRQQISTVKNRRDAMAADLKKQQAVANSDDLPANDDPTVNAGLRQLQSQLHANQLEIAGRERDIKDLQGKINKYEALEAGAPAVEQQLDDLKRGYEQSQKDFNDLTKKEHDAEEFDNLTKAHQGERFSMLDPASLPLKPDFPNRLKFCGMGLGIGIALGIAVVLAFEFLDDRMHSESEIKAVLLAPVLSEIPEVLSPSDISASRRKLVVAWVATGFVVVFVLAGSAFSYLRN